MKKIALIAVLALFAGMYGCSKPQEAPAPVVTDAVTPAASTTTATAPAVAPVAEKK
ncbi:MAG: hypothetical protein WC955_07865 [Elusimicrobiota bacterium]